MNYIINIFPVVIVLLIIIGVLGKYQKLSLPTSLYRLLKIIIWIAIVVFGIILLQYSERNNTIYGVLFFVLLIVNIIYNLVFTSKK